MEANNEHRDMAFILTLKTLFLIKITDVTEQQTAVSFRSNGGP